MNRYDKTPTPTPLWARLIIWGLLVVAIISVVSVYLAVQSLCHRVTGPLVTESDDPVAIAVYCRGGK